MKKISIIGFVLACCLLSACSVFQRKQQEGAAAELNGQYLYYATLDSLTLGLSPEDSARVAEQYISQWAKDILLYDNAFAHTNANIERMVEDYRRTLYVHAYEEHLIDRRMSKEVSDSTEQEVYERLSDRFMLNESIVQGLLVVVNNDAQKVAKLRQWLTDVAKPETEKINTKPKKGKSKEKTLDNIEKYAYQNANGYELFTDKWLTTTELLAHVPIERAELESRLKTENQIEVSDSTNTYILQVTNKCLRGTQMPLDYARPQIRKIVLSLRQVGFLQDERERMYKDAIKSEKIRFYEKK